MKLSSFVSTLGVGIKDLSAYPLKDIFLKLADGLRIANKEGVSLLTVLSSEKFKSAVSGNMVSGINMTAASATALISTVTAGLSLAIGAGVGAWQYFEQKYQKTKEAVADSISTFNQSTDSIDSNIKSLESLEERFKTLSKSVSSNLENINLSAESYEEFRGIISELIKINPELEKTFADGNITLTEKNNLIREQIELQKELQSENNKVIISQGSDIFKVASKESKKLINDLNSALELQKTILDAQNGKQSTMSSDAGLLAQKMGIKTNMHHDEFGQEVYYLPLDISETDISAVQGKVIDLKNQLDEKYSGVNLVIKAVLDEQSTYKDLPEQLRGVMDKVIADTDWTAFGNNFSGATDYINGSLNIVKANATTINDILFSTAQLSDMAKNASVDQWAESYNAAIDSIISKLEQVPALKQLFGLENLSLEELKVHAPVAFNIDVASQDQAKKGIEDIKRLVQEVNLNNVNVDDLGDSLSKLNPEKIELISAYFNDANVKGKQAITTFIETERNLSKIDPVQLEKTLQTLTGIALTNAARAIELTAEQLEELSKSMTTAAKAAYDLQKAQEAMSKSGEVDPESLNTIISLYPQAIAYANDFAKMQEFVSSKIAEQEQIALQAYGSIVLANSSAVSDIIKNSSALPGALAKYYNVDLQNFKKMSDSKYKAEAQTVALLSDLWQKYAGLNASTIDNQINNMMRAGVSGKLTEGAESTLKELVLFKDLFESVESNFADIDLDFDKAKATSSSSKDPHKEAAEQLIKDIQYARDKSILAGKDEVEAYRKYYSEMASINAQYYAGRSEYIDDFRKYELEVLNGQEKLHNDSYNKEKNNLDLLLKENAISEEDYYNRLKKLNDNYYAGIAKYADEYRKNEIEVLDGREKLHNDSYNKERNNLELLLKEKTISEENYYNRLRKLNNDYYAGVAKYADEYRKNEIEAIQGLQAIMESRLNEQLGLAEKYNNYSHQLEIYKQLQDNLHAVAEEYRSKGLKETDVEILQLQNKWWEYYQSRKDIIAKSHESDRTQLDYKITIAEENSDYGEQIKLYKQYQESLHKEANAYRALGLKETDVEILELQKKYRAFNSEVVNTFVAMFDSERDVLGKKFSKLEFKLSLTSDADYATKEKLINEQLENRLANSQKLINQMTQLRLETDNNMKATKEYAEAMSNLQSAYDDTVKSAYDLVQAQKSIAEQQISEVREFQEDIIKILKAKYDDQKKLIKDTYDSEIEAIDGTLSALKKMWDAEDRRKQQQNDADDVSDIQAKINELRIAAATGDAEAVSRIEDLQKELAKKKEEIAESEEKNRRADIEQEYSDQKEALTDQYNLDIEGIDNKLENANLYSEARKMIESGMYGELTAMRLVYENEFGEGMGILGTYVKDRLVSQIDNAKVALSELSKNIYIMSTNNKSAAIYDTMFGMQQEQYTVLEEMKANSEAWLKSTTDAERKYYSDRNKELGDSIGLYRDDAEGVWYMDESKTQRLYDVWGNIQQLQSNSIEFIGQKYQEDYDAFSESLELKLEAIQSTNVKIVDDVQKTNKELQEEYKNLPVPTGEDIQSNYWYLDESKIESIKMTLEELHKLQISHLEELNAKYKEHFDKFGTVQDNKLQIIRLLNNGIISDNNNLYNILNGCLVRFTENVAITADNIAGLISSLVSMMNNVATQFNNQFSSQTTSTATVSQAPVQRFATGGLNRGAGLRFLDPNEQVLTAEQTKAFTDLVFGLGSTGMQNIANAIQANQPNLNNIIANNTRTVQADFNFYGSITQEAMPQVKKMIGDAVYELKRQVPEIVARSHTDNARRFGYSR